jgi:hypothetical protein
MNGQSEKRFLGWFRLPKGVTLLRYGAMLTLAFPRYCLLLVHKGILTVKDATDLNNQALPIFVVVIALCQRVGGRPQGGIWPMEAIALEPRMFFLHWHMDARSFLLRSS